MLLGEDGDQYGLYIDISNNIVWEVKNPEQACWEGETGRAGGVTAWLKKQIYPYIMDNEEEIPSYFYAGRTAAAFPVGAKTGTAWLPVQKRKVHYLLSCKYRDV